MASENLGLQIAVSARFRYQGLGNLMQQRLEFLVPYYRNRLGLGTYAYVLKAAVIKILGYTDGIP